MRRIKAFINRCVPETARAHPEMARRAHLAASSSVILVCVGYTYTLIFGLMGLPVLTLACLIGGTFSGVGLAALHFTGSVELAGHSISAAVSAAVTIAVMGVGGIHTGAILWYAVPPVIAASISGVGAIRFWGAAGVVAVIGLALINAAGMTPHSEIPASASDFVVVVLAGGGLIVITLFGVHQTRGIKRLLGEVQEAQDAAQHAHDEARLLLDNVNDGLVTLGPDGLLTSERSRRFDTLFGNPAVQTPVWRLFDESPNTALWLETGWEQLFEGFMPIEVSADQLPKQVNLGDIELKLSWQPVDVDTAAPKVLLIARDVTLERAARREAARERSELNLFRQIVADRPGFKSFLTEAQRLVNQALVTDASPVAVMLAVHTLKGAVGVLGLNDFEQVCHELETEILASSVVDPEQRRRLLEAWVDLKERSLALLGNGSDLDGSARPRS